MKQCLFLAIIPQCYRLRQLLFAWKLNVLRPQAREGEMGRDARRGGKRKEWRLNQNLSFHFIMIYLQLGVCQLRGQRQVWPPDDWGDLWHCSLDRDWSLSHQDCCIAWSRLALLKAHCTKFKDNTYSGKKYLFWQFIFVQLQHGFARGKSIFVDLQSRSFN